MAKYLPTFRKVGMLVLPSFMIVLAFCYYFFIYVKNREKIVTERSYRILENVNETVKSKIDYHIDRIKNKANKLVESEVEFKADSFVINVDSVISFEYKDQKLKESLKDLNVLTYAITFKELFTDITDNKYFEGLIIIEVKRKSSEKQLPARILYNTYSKADFLETQLDKVINNPEDVVETVKLEGENHKLFLHSIPQLSNTNNKYLIGGLMKEDRFKGKQRSIPFLTLLFFSIIFILLLFSYPFLKLILIGPLERISIYDIVLVISSIILGSSIITLTFWEVYNHYYKYNWKQEQSLTAINTQIKTEFINEVKLAVTELQRQKESSTFRNIVQLLYELKEDSTNRKVTPGKLDIKKAKLHQWGQELIHKNKKYFQYERVTGDALNGDELFSFDVKNKKKELFNVRERGYFKDIIDSNFWHFEHKKESTDTTGFAIQSIQSWLDRSRYMIVSVPSDPPVAVLNLSTKPYSLTSAILPDNIQYCIIDGKGNVLFHHSIQKNLQENFLKECNRDPAITSAIFARTTAIAEINYLEEDYTAVISPIANWPLFLVVFQNNKYEQLLSTESVTLCLEFTFIKFLLSALLIFAQALQFPKNNKLKFNWLQMDWLRPDFQKTERCMSARKFLFWCLLFVSLSGLIFYQANSIAPILSLYFLFPLYVFLGVYMSLNGIKYQNLRNPRHLSFIMPIGVLLVFLSTATFTINEAPYNYLLILFQVVLLLPLLRINHTKFRSLFTKLNKFLNGKALDIGLSFGQPPNYIKVYRSTIILWILISSIIPQFMLYAKIRSFETELAEKHDLLNVAQRILIKKRIYNRDSRFKHFPNDSIKGIYNISSSVSDAKFYEDRPNEFNKMLAKFRLSYDTVLVRQSGLLDNYSNRTWMWKDNVLSYNPKISSLIPEGKVLNISKTDYKKNLSVIDFYFFILFILFLVFLYQIINFFIHKVFILKLFSNKINCTSYENDINKMIQQHKCVFIVDVFNIIRPLRFSSPNIRLLTDEMIKQELKEKTLQPTGKDLHSELDNLWENDECIYLYSLTFNINDLNENEFKALILSRLVRKSERVIIMSPVHPIQIIRAFSKAAYLSDNVDPAVPYSVLCNNWTNLLKYFYIVYNHKNEYLKSLGITLQISHSEQSKETLLKIFEGKTEIMPSDSGSIVEFRNKLLSAITKECRHSEYLTDVADPLFRYAADIVNQYVRIGKYRIPFSEMDSHVEEIIVKIQNLAQVYYSSLWSNCSSEEKLILYDLAEDDLLNSKNVYIIQNLLSKGLIIEEHGLEIMNASFRNYILTIIEPAEALAMENEVNKRSTWPVFNTIIVLVLLALGIFILMTQEDMSKTVTIITGFITSVPLIIRLFTAITEVKAKTNDK